MEGVNAGVEKVRKGAANGGHLPDQDHEAYRSRFGIPIYCNLRSTNYFIPNKFLSLLKNYSRDMLLRNSFRNDDNF